MEKFLCLGMKPGTKKTTIGNPDTYFRKENCRYVFVVYTTEQEGIYNKIKKDIDKCLDFSKTGIEEKYKEMFNCDEWNLYKLIGDKYKYSGLDYKRYQISREKNIIEFVNKLSLNEVEQLVISINKIYIDNFKDTNEVYDMSVGVNIIVDNICNEEEKAIKFFYSYIDNKCSFIIFILKNYLNYLFVCSKI